MPSRRFSNPLRLALAVALAATGGMVVAQVDTPGQGVTPIDSSGSYEVSGINVDVTGKTADAARTAGWRLAQRKGWQALSTRLGAGGGLVSDGTLDAMVSGIVVENEQIGPNRYVARLGILFSRARAGALLGVASQALRSPPMLVIPVQWAGGTAQVFEQRTAWQEAWARFRTGNSTVDYVRPAGTGSDSLLLNQGQTGRPGRGWWRTILDQYGASDVVVPVVRLYPQWPGGPVIGVFEARHGPDNHIIARFTLRVGSSDGLPVLLDAGVKRIDEAYQTALRTGVLRTDPALTHRPPSATPTPTATPTDQAQLDAGGTAATSGGTVVTIQVDTPGAASVASTESALRGVPGVRSAIITSLALGGVSVMHVSYDADPALLRAALEARGWVVQSSGTTFRIRRAGAPTPGATAPAAENATGG
jgi:hypothetical protein